MSNKPGIVDPDADLASSLVALLETLPDQLPTGGGIDPRVWDEALLDPAREVLSRSGKGFRGRMVEHGWALAGAEPATLPELLPLSVELLHAGSLVIDDIEDDSRVRRGRPTLHRLVGVPVALNTGNWLYFLAMAFLSKLPFDSNVRLAMHDDVSLTLLRCHEGQALDLSVRMTSARRADVASLVERCTRLKTGSLMRLAALLGARGAGGSPDAVDAIARFGAELGVGLQMLDDWSGATVEARREKGVEDIKLARPTWLWAWLAEAGDELAYAETVRQVRARSIDWEAHQLLKRLGALLESTALTKIRAQLDSAFEGLERTLGTSAGLSAVRADMDRLESAFIRHG